MFNPLLFLENILKALIELFQTPPRSHDLVASFGEPRDALSRNAYGFSITGKEQLVRKLSFQNVLVVGTTGSGKTSSSLIPSILKLNGSLVIHDPSGELYEKTSGYLKENGYLIKVFNPAEPSLSDSFNVCSYAKDHSDLHKVARSLVQSTRNTASGEPIWDELATSLISLLLRGLSMKPKRFQNLPNVLHLLNELAIDPSHVRPFFAATGHHGLIQEFDAFAKYEDKLRTSVLASAKGALHYLADERIAEVTSTDTLDLRTLRTRKTAIFIQNKIGEGAYYKPLSSLFFESLFSVLFDHRPEHSDHDVYLLLDEASSLVCPTLPLAIANLRKYRVGMMLCLQEFSQLVDIYGAEGAETIRSNCYGKLYHGGGSLQSCEEISRMLGLYTFTDSDGIKRNRSLMTPDEIRMLPPSRALFVSGTARPLLVRLRPYFKQRSLAELTRIPAVVRSPHRIDSIPRYPLSVDRSNG